MKKYPEYKDSGVEWLGEIPVHWEISSLKRISDKITDGSHFSPKSIQFGKPYVTVRDVNNGMIDIENCKKIDDSEFDLLVKNGCKPQKGDVLISKDGTIGRGVVVDSEEEFVILSSLGLIRPNKNKTNSKFLKYYLLSGLNVDQMMSFIKGSALTRITIEVIKRLLVVQPTIEEQTAIANFLDLKTQQIDDLIAKKQRLIELLKEERTAVINQAVTKGLDPNVPMKDSGIEWLGEIPEHWGIIKLKRCVVKIGSGITPRGGSTVYQDEGVALIRSQNVKFEGLDLNDVAFISDEINASMKNSEVKYGDVLLNITGASIGRCCLYAESIDANVNQHVCIIRPEKENNSLFLNYILQSSYGQNLIRYNITGSGREGLNFENISNFKIPHPNLHEQEEIVYYINTKWQQNERQIDVSKQQIQYLIEYKTSLINEAVTGKIDVRDYQKSHATE